MTAQREWPVEARSVALVDDNDYDNEYTQIILSKAGFRGQVLVYSSAEQAMKAATDGDLGVDLALVDINMPGMDGFEFAEWMRRAPLPARPWLVLLSSSSSTHERRRAERSAGIQEMITKPLTVAVARRLLRFAPPDYAGDPSTA